MFFANLYATEPNFDRIGNYKLGKRVFVKKIVINNMDAIKRILEFEQNYDDSLKYALIPEATKKSYNSNSYFRGVIENAGLFDYFEVPSCFKSPGLSKSIVLNS